MPGESPPLRLFFALWPGPPLQAALAAWGRRLQRELGGRPTRRENIHLTLAFLGDTEARRLDALRGIGERIDGTAFELTIDRVGCWPHSGVAWAGSREIPDALRSLALRLREKLLQESFPIEQREFAPHITLVRKALCAPLHWQPGEALNWVVDRLVLARSELGPEGSSYSELAGWPLGS
ncbi:MAG TPA: RNA 2',3'-cyclic phosphodiesterase [Burkholderiales bacterium]|nr:RNA 2',3'-cyclic phosphodiesterase [Burkholderiales bacterium]